MFGDLVIYWILISLNYILLATGLTLCISVMRILNFAHGHLYMAGAFLFYYFMLVVGFPYGIALLLTMLIIGGLGIIIEMGIFRPLYSPSIISISVIESICVLYSPGGIRSNGMLGELDLLSDSSGVLFIWSLVILYYPFFNPL